MAKNDDLMLGGFVGGAIVAAAFILIAMLGGDLDDTRNIEQGGTDVCEYRTE